MTHPLTASTITDDILDDLQQELDRLRAAVALHHPVRDGATGRYGCAACTPQAAAAGPGGQHAAGEAWPCNTARTAGTAAPRTGAIAPQSLRGADDRG
ncbi:hypothetical protein [Streptomyces sp. CC224B]|uniref:hypothetical protein n=1 Tax=Streptomyces sp. CC224B TaxID=3044571 RepID=UPI0024A7EDC0|nr:hypothetical protein [Streptomyces sp. CC224B]